jgi:hypothetical protein
LELLHEMEIPRTGRRVTPEETSEAAALGVGPLDWEEDDASIDAAASGVPGCIGNDADERNDADASKRTSDARTNADDEPYVWAFVHVPKSAGSYVTEVFRAHIWRFARASGDESARAARARRRASQGEAETRRANDASELSRRALLDDSGVVGETRLERLRRRPTRTPQRNVAAAFSVGCFIGLSVPLHERFSCSMTACFTLCTAACRTRR